MLTSEQFASLFPNLPEDLRERYRAAIEAAAAVHDIATPDRWAAFLAQVGHESLGLTRLEESFSYSAERLMVVFPSSVKTWAEAHQLVALGSQSIANHVYAGKNGNEEPGDGWRYRGRGLVMLTGRGNYREYGFENSPDDLRKIEQAALVAGAYWRRHGCNQLADAMDFKGITRAIAGSMQGWTDRVSRWRAARSILGLAPADILSVGA